MLLQVYTVHTVQYTYVCMYVCTGTVYIHIYLHYRLDFIRVLNPTFSFPSSPPRSPPTLKPPSKNKLKEVGMYSTVHALRQGRKRIEDRDPSRSRSYLYIHMQKRQ